MAVQFLSTASKLLQTAHLTLAAVILIASGIAVSEAAIHQDDSYAPGRFGIPDTIGGYAVVAVLSEDNFVCMQPGQKRLLLQSPQPNIEAAIHNFPKDQRELGGLEVGIVGPGRSREQLLTQLKQLYTQFELQECQSFQLQAPSDCKLPDNLPGGQCKAIGRNDPNGYVIIQNDGINPNVSDRSATRRNDGRDLRELSPLGWPSVALEGGGFGRC